MEPCLISARLGSAERDQILSDRLHGAIDPQHEFSELMKSRSLAWPNAG